MRRHWLLAAVLLTGIALAGCGEREPLRIGFVGPLSGKGVGLGIGGRDGTQLAVEEVNRAGGIGGRPLQLLVEDDGQEKEQAALAVARLADAGAVAIIGHMTSSMTVATLPLANERKILMVSPTSSGEDLTGLDDYLFRLHAPIGDLARQLANVLADQRKIRRVAVIIDYGNQAYTVSFFQQFRPAFEARGGAVTALVNFVSAESPRYGELAANALQDRPDALLLLANAADSAMIAQQVHKRGEKVLLVGSEWSATQELITMGGDAVEGMLFVHGVDSTSQQPSYLRFVGDFEQRFGYAPGFPAVYAYETTQVLVRALREDSSPERLRATIARIGRFDGLQGPTVIDRFGDCVRSSVPLVVADGRFVAGRVL